MKNLALKATYGDIQIKGLLRPALNLTCICGIQIYVCVITATYGDKKKTSPVYVVFKCMIVITATYCSERINRTCNGGLRLYLCGN